ncbi:hypothetical protein [Grimontia hollisae]|uniref:hypothetical protein n=1 Tax=Grimontia hollisae TaxID=673 RepID=UPI0013032902|nr:hypothetical protein [Grimontia hollisae]
MQLISDGYIIYNGRLLTSSELVQFEMKHPRIEPIYSADELISCRKAAYVTESDPLYMEWQFDKTPEKEHAWRDKVAEIKARYPLPE